MCSSQVLQVDMCVLVDLCGWESVVVSVFTLSLAPNGSSGDDGCNCRFRQAHGLDMDMFMSAAGLIVNTSQ